MSGETLVVGSLELREGTPEKTKLKLLEQLATALEVEVSDLRYNIFSHGWDFQNINWQSHVEKESIEAFLKKRKGFIKRFVCSLHHLNDPDQINYCVEEQPDSRKNEVLLRGLPL